MPVDPKRLKELFLAASEIPSPDERAAFLDRECGTDVELRRRLEVLLRAHDDSGGFLAQPAEAPAVTVDSVAGESEGERGGGEAVGDVIGPYKLLQKLGEGGMGTVWVAEQTRPVKRRVALKVIKPGLDSAQVLRRFEAERNALALMDHTHIAKVFDAGTTPTGRPFFVMELVHGVPITRYCDELNLPIRERLELFVPVCQAIQHAHQKGIIHRDVKPSNVLVCMQDGKPVAKVIDFGVAKAMNQRLTEGTVYTEFGAVVGTLEYMAPEQAEVSPLGVDTRADVYALGVLLYELLTGTTPLDRKRLKQAAFLEMLRLIKEEEPPRPSTRLSESKETLASVAAQRRTEPARLTKQVRGELDWIAMKCLEKDRTRRYETASALARDVEHYLADEAVEACPPSAGYRLRKLLRRHRAAVTTAAALAALLAAGAAVSTWQAVRARAAEKQARESEGQALAERDAKEAARQAEADQRRRADDEAAVAKAVNEFLRNDLLGQADIGNQAGGERNPNVTVRELLDRAAQRIEGRFAGREVTEAAIRLTLGNAYRALGEYPEAEKHLERSVQLRRQQLGADHPDTLMSMNDLAVLDWSRGRYGEAESLYKQVLAGWRVRRGADHADTLLSMTNLADIYRERGRYDEAEPLFKEALAGYRATLGADHPDALRCLNNLAMLYQNSGRYDEAEPLQKQVLEGFRAKLGADHPSTLTCMNNLAGLYKARGRYDEAEPLFKQALTVSRAKLGAGHPETLLGMNNLASIYADCGRYDEAEPLLVEAVAGLRKKLGPAHPYTFGCMANLADVYARQRRPEPAEPLLRELAAVLRDKPGPDSPAYAAQLAALSRNLLEQKKYADAEAVARECLTIRRKNEPGAPATYNIESMLGAALLGQQKYTEAEPLLKEGYEGLKRSQGKSPEQVRTARLTEIPEQVLTARLTEALERLVRLYEATGRDDEATKWRKELYADAERLPPPCEEKP